MKYLKPEMDIVEFDESVLTSIQVSGKDDNLGGGGGSSLNPNAANEI